MPPPSKKELRERAQHTYDLIDGSIKTIRRTSDLIIDNGMWLALSVDVFLVTGRVCPKNEILWGQRDALVKTLKIITDEKWAVDLPVLPDLQIPNPMASLGQLLRPFVKELEKRHPDEKPEESLTTEGTIEWGLPDIPWTPGGAWHELWETGEKLEATAKDEMGWSPGCYKALPLVPRLFLALVVPGILRELMQMAKGGMNIAAKLI